MQNALKYCAVGFILPMLGGCIAKEEKPSMPESHEVSFQAQIEEKRYGKTSVITVTPVDWVDNTGATPAIHYVWYVNGVSVANHAASFLDGASFNKGDTVHAILTPLLRDGFGAPVTSNTLRIENEAPSIWLAPLAGPYFRNSTIAAQADTFDPDGDEVKVAFEWRVNGNRVSSEGGSLANVFRKTDEVSVTAEAFDSEGSSRTDSPPIAVQNSAPSSPIVTVFPSHITTGTLSLWANMQTASTDIDDDPITYVYQWYQNGTPLGFPTSQTFFTGVNFTLGDVWLVVVRASDGESLSLENPTRGYKVFSKNSDPDDPEAPAIEAILPDHASLGNLVRVSGSGFGDNGILLLGATPVVTLEWNENEILFEVGNWKAGAMEVQVQVDGKNSNSKTLHIVPKIVAVSPNPISTGTTLTLAGNNFGATQAALDKVTVGGIDAQVISWSSTQIEIELHPTLLAGQHHVEVWSGAESGIYEGLDIFPHISAASPQPAISGGTLELGTQWAGDIAVTVYLGEVSVSPLQVYPSGLTVSVPSNVVAGSTLVTLEINDRTSTPYPIVVRPSISAVDPTIAEAESAVVLHGAGFSPSMTSNTIAVGGVSAQSNAASGSALGITLPVLAPGVHDVVVTTNGQASNPVTITVVPALFEIYPSFGTGGTVVTIRGAAFGESAGDIVLGTTSVLPLTWSASEIQFSVPTGLRAGVYPVRINSNGYYSAPVTFALYPFLRSAAAITGQAGLLELIGQNFGPTSDGSHVFADARTVASTSWSNSAITVDPQMPGGSRTIYVIVNNLESNRIRLNFQRPWLDDRYPASGTSGTEVTLTGRNLGGLAGSVTVGGVTAIVDGWSDTNVQIRIPLNVPKGQQMIRLTAADGQISNALPFTQLGPDVWVLYDGQDARYAMGANVPMGEEWFLWGGNTAIGTQIAVRYNPNGDTWKNVNMVGAPIYAQHFLWTGSEVLAYGGYRRTQSGTTEYLAGGARYAPDSDSWAPMSSNGAPVDYMLTSIWSGREAVFWPRSCTTGGAIYQPSTDTWTSLPAGLPVIWRPVVGGRNLYFEGRDCQSGVYYGYRFNLDEKTLEVISGALVNTNWYHFWIGRESLFYDDLGASLLWLHNPDTRNWRSAIYAGPAEDLDTFWIGDRLLFLTPYTIGKAYYFYPDANTWHVPSTSGVQVNSDYTSTGEFKYRRAYTTGWMGDYVLNWGALDSYSLQEGNTFSGWSVTREKGVRFDLRTNEWSWMTPPRNDGPMMAQHAGIWTGSQMLVWGGFESKHYEPEKNYTTYAPRGGRYDPVTDIWLPISSVNAPSNRHSHTAVWTGTKMLVWGGLVGSAGLGDGAAYHPATDTWVTLSAADAPSPRGMHTAHWAGDRMLVWGGHSAAVAVGTGAEYFPATNLWNPLPVTGSPSPRYSHTAVWSGNELLVWGGRSGTVNRGDGSRYDPIARKWYSLPATGAPIARYAHAAVWATDRMLIWGGEPYTTAASAYLPTSDSWIPISPMGAPTPSSHLSAVWTGSKMLVWGGLRAGLDYTNRCLNAGGSYDPTLNSWTPITLQGAPLGRQFHTAMWDGTRLLVWGGDVTCRSDASTVWWSGSSAGGIYYPAP